LERQVGRDRVDLGGSDAPTAATDTPTTPSATESGGGALNEPLDSLRLSDRELDFQACDDFERFAGLDRDPRQARGVGPSRLRRPGHSRCAGARRRQ
jgi:hypothetical protein